MATNELPEYADRVLDVVERIPPGRVMTYGDVAAWLRDARDEPDEPDEPDEHGGADTRDEPDGHGGADGHRPRVVAAPLRRGPGPRQVGRVMALYGAAVPWWRVVRADGVLLPGQERRALEHYRAEGTPLRGAGAGRAGHPAPRIDLPRARWPGSEPRGESPVAWPEDAQPSDPAAVGGA